MMWNIPQPRDENGWMLPRDGTKAYAYAFAMAIVAGDPIEDAAAAIGRSKQYL